jgi:hypothetical protein
MLCFKEEAGPVNPHGIKNFRPDVEENPEVA